MSNINNEIIDKIKLMNSIDGRNHQHTNLSLSLSLFIKRLWDVIWSPDRTGSPVKVQPRKPLTESVKAWLASGVPYGIGYEVSIRVKIS